MPAPARRSRNILLLALLASAIAAPQPCAGQTQPAQPAPKASQPPRPAKKQTTPPAPAPGRTPTGKPAAAPAPAATPVQFIPTPLPEGVVLRTDGVRFETLGLTLRVPQETVIQTTSVGTARQSVMIRPDDNTWTIEVSDRVTRDKTLAPSALADDVLRSLMRARERGVKDDTGQVKVVGSAAEVIDKAPNILLGVTPAAMFYLGTLTADNTRIVTGYIIARSEPGRFVVFALSCLPAELDRARAIYENVVASAEFRNPIDAATERSAGVAAGAELLASLSREEYAALASGGPKYFRLYRPAPTGAPADATEVAYQVIDVRAGVRGELDPRKPRDKYNAADNDPGFIASVAARFLDEGRTVDTEATFFATLSPTPDTDEEVWFNRMLVRDRKDVSTWTQKGARLGNRLTVQTQGAGQELVEKQWLTPERGYLTQVQIYLLQRMLARAGKPVTYSFYAFNAGAGAQAGDITLRRDVLEPAPAGQGSGWTLRTRIGEGVAERVTTLSAEGDILRVETGDGVVMEPIEPDALQRLWRSKGLPTNDASR